MADFAELQAEHQRLLHRLDEDPNSAELPGAVKAYVDRARTESTAIGAPRDRDQLRANLRFWGSFLFDRTGEYPDTTLRPPAAGVADLTGSTAPTGEAWSPADIEVKTEPQPDVGQPPIPAPGRSPLAIIGAVAAIAVLALLLCVAVFWVGYQSQVGYFVPTPTGPGLVQTVHAALTRTQAALPTTMASQTSAPAATTIDTATPTPAPTAAPVDTATGGTTPSPTAPPSPTGAASLPYQRLQLLAQVSQPAEPANCASRTLEIDADLGRALAAEDVRGGAVVVTRIGGDNVAAVPFTNTLTLDLAKLGVAQDRTLLLQVDHPKLTFASVILQFSADCTRNKVVVRYEAQKAPSYLASEPARSPDLDLTWDLVTWGPSPQEPQQWVAELHLDAQGGDGQYIFWDDRTALANNSLLLVHQGCDPERRLIGVSSGGEAVLREIVLQAPVCQ